MISRSDSLKHFILDAERILGFIEMFLRCAINPGSLHIFLFTGFPEHSFSSAEPQPQLNHRLPGKPCPLFSPQWKHKNSDLGWMDTSPNSGQVRQENWSWRERLTGAVSSFAGGWIHGWKGKFPPAKIICQLLAKFSWGQIWERRKHKAEGFQLFHGRNVQPTSNRVVCTWRKNPGIFLLAWTELILCQCSAKTLS